MMSRVALDQEILNKERIWRVWIVIGSDGAEGVREYFQWKWLPGKKPKIKMEGRWLRLQNTIFHRETSASIIII